jgi:hypothetical protein
LSLGGTTVPFKKNRTKHYSGYPASQIDWSFRVGPAARIFVIKFDTVNGLELMTRMLNQQSASRHNSDGSKWQHMLRAVIGDGFLFWYNRAGASVVGKAVGLMRQIPRGHISPIIGTSRWAPSGVQMRRELTFQQIDNMMGNRISERGIIQWTIF